MALFAKGKHYNKDREFRVGQIPWNKGKKYEILPEDKWSRKFDRCVICKTDSKYRRNKHYIRGRCRSCYYKERSQTVDKEKNRLKYAGRWEEIKKYPELHQNVLKFAAEARQKSKAYKKYVKFRSKKARYERFVNWWFGNKSKIKKKHKGIIINFEHDDKVYKIQTPLKKIIGKEEDLDLFRKILIKYIEKNGSSRIQGDVEEKSL